MYIYRTLSFFSSIYVYIQHYLVLVNISRIRSLKVVESSRDGRNKNIKKKFLLKNLFTIT